MPTLQWIGKEKVINHHLEVPVRVLEHQFGINENGRTTAETGSGNKIIHGDNLEALKALLPEYEGRIKCIYIDPPYNTGNEGWVYNDNVNDPKIKKWINDVVGREGEDLTRHDKWLCMMYPRLRLLQKLLAKDGALVISVGYQEVFNLMPVVKELFATKQIACVTVQTSGGKPSGSFNYQHEYLIFVVPDNFEPNPMNFTGGRERTPFEGLTLATFDKTQRPNQTYPIFVNIETSNLEGVGESLQERIKNGAYQDTPKNFEYNFNEAPEGTVAVWPVTNKGKECVWRLTPNRLINDWNKGYIKISPNRQKNSLNKYSVQYLPEGVIKKIERGILKVNGKENNSPTLTFGENKTVGSDIPTIWLEKDFHSVKGTTLLDDIFTKKVFNYPKPLPLITEILRALTSSDDIILDSFAGSGTTAHAVLNLNKLDGENRKFILVEMEDYAETITAERVKRVIQGYADAEGTGGSFDYLTLGERIFTEDNEINPNVSLQALRKYIWYTETGEPYCTASKELHKSYLGTKNSTAYFFHYKHNEESVLNRKFLKKLTMKADAFIIYTDKCILPQETLALYNITFKKIPRDINKY